MFLAGPTGNESVRDGKGKTPPVANAAAGSKPEPESESESESESPWVFFATRDAAVPLTAARMLSRARLSSAEVESRLNGERNTFS